MEIESQGDEVLARYEDENGESMDEEDVEDDEWESDDDGGGGGGDGGEREQYDVQMADAADGSLQTPPTSLSATPSDTSKRNEENTRPAAAPESYLILNTPVPSSHPFASRLATDTPTHMKRTAKEHKILRSPDALPSGVYVRTWDSRLDLLRVLFIGPGETPYADAPFVIDFYLPSSFPSEPPQAYFHSWTSENGLGGVGRVNPNLYEDGKICLSLLGTWEGSKGERWSAGRSTLLQVIVSLLGLVLVREPYFNEAGYEPLASLESLRRPSAMYSERTFLRARTFVISALLRLGSADAAGVEGLEHVLRWLYRDGSGPRLLHKTAEDVRTVLERSERGSEEPDGLSVMSKGACIPLRRVLDRLRLL